MPLPVYYKLMWNTNQKETHTWHSTYISINNKIKLLNLKIVILYKPVNWFAEQINRLVSIW